MSMKIFKKIISTFIGSLIDFIDEKVDDKEEANKLKAILEAYQKSAYLRLAETQASLIMAEYNGTWLQKNWRAIVMIIIAIAIVALGRTDLIDMLKIGLSGFIG
ncbi:hypothetical protein [Vibrio parahaemolyticus]|uniref:hypothetical protein n=1 Tax=Vibrio parahaemolyticus TaxID=670 RepID=UPI000FEC3BDC|nr:hypothetical protein [Vibrio parahaemolyticus]ELB2092042.1 hypothetical protein [Vibrio parahaemolyticus]MBE4408838.1 hypothetical protein [Vibrio parahaemolyticus]MCC3789364.1 hypothetical protein [Vibrio parahaemolyticus]MCX8758821.1 hypothetical protein [Vibrio parahaemolyticus]MDF4982395.1 hypothetical protein [Vibrio parahaemolyticus]